MSHRSYCNLVYSYDKMSVAKMVQGLWEAKMQRKTIPGCMTFRYREVFRITEWRDGDIYKTEKVGIMRSSDASLLPDTFVLAPLSTRLTSLPSFEADVLDLEDIHG